MKDITSFTSDYRWLSNFHEKPLWLAGLRYPTAEHAYQAFKAKIASDHELVRQARTPGQAKRLGRKVELRPNWEEVKHEVMLDVLLAKFGDEMLRAKLLATGDALLVEGNTWGDRYWGQVDGVGENHLGRLLMGVREHYREEEA